MIDPSLRMLAGLVVSFMTVSAARADAQLPASLQGVAFDQRLNQPVPLDAVFRDETGHTVKLGDYFGEKPVILLLVQYRCPMLCGQMLNGLVRALLDVPLDMGKDFDVVTVSFDPREKPELAAAKKKSYLERYGRRGAEEGWHFLTGEQGEIDRLCAATGFRYRYDAVHDQYAHASGIMVLTPGGKIARYFYDIQYSARDLRLGLVEASQGKIGTAGDQVLLFCFHYDPVEGKYGPAVMNIVRVAGVLTVLGIGCLFVVLRRQERRKAGLSAASNSGVAAGTAN